MVIYNLKNSYIVSKELFYIALNNGFKLNNPTEHELGIEIHPVFDFPNFLFHLDEELLNTVKIVPLT